ncbi:hypothetical protein LJB86_06010 [Deltaproteobacteria bacterium OttesenSCG-928-M10]|nr:hypothetical protein [Deltaproteobacteria bacterium OttesenSCG-928-M10]
MKIPTISAFIMALILGSAHLLSAHEWPERGVTLVTSVPQVLPWSDEPAPQSLILKAIEPRLSRELGVPATLVGKPEGNGVLAANTVADANPDGYLVGALGSDSAIIRVIQGYTPYIWNEFVPVATGWREIYALITLAEAQADDLAGLARAGDRGRFRLGHTGLSPIDAGTLLALEAARTAGFSWTLTKIERLDPGVLLQDQADAIVLPLGQFKLHPQLDKFKVVTVFTSEDDAPCAKGLPTLKSQGLNASSAPLLAFYVPNQVNWRLQARLSAAITNSLRQPAVRQRLEAACLKPYLEDLEGAGSVMNQEYKRWEELLRLFRFVEP